MFTFIKQKLLHKKWLNACLVIGIVILIAVATCLPMYQNMAKNQTFQNILKEYINENSKYPTEITLSGGLSVKEGTDAFASTIKHMEKYQEMLKNALGVATKENIQLVALQEDNINPLKNAGGRVVSGTYRFAYMSDFENHIKIIGGKMYQNTAEVKADAGKEKDVISIDGNTKYTCVVSAALLEDSGLYIGQTVGFDDLKGKDGDSLKVTITGVFEEKDTEDAYWINAPGDYTMHFFMSKEMFQEALSDVSGDFSMKYQVFSLYDYENMDIKDVPVLHENLKRCMKAGLDGPKVDLETDLLDVLEEYMETQKKISATLWILELPILVLILIFIYMISSQILELEGNEIATLKSRGVSVGQIIGLYFCQSSILAGISVIVGLLFGYGICRLLGQSNAFLEFVERRDLPVQITGETLLYCLLAVVLAVAFMTLPLIKIARADIVARKSKRSQTDRGIFDRYFLDVVLLVVSGYAYYSFQGQKEEIAQKVLNGDGLDPFLFLSASLFMVGLGMVLLRVFRLLVNVVYRIGEKKWSPAMYASFLQIMRTRGKQGFISLFLVVALAMGVFYSNVARTINQNEEDRTYYNLGTDMVVKEEWTKLTHTGINEAGQKVISITYEEPANNLDVDVKELAKSSTKVIQRTVTVKGAGSSSDSGQLMAVQTKEFGETAWMRDGELDKHWYNYLNDLAAAPGNILVSTSMKEKFGLKLGDTISCSPPKSENEAEIDTMGIVTGTVCGFVDAWPGYTGFKTVTDESGVKTQEPVYLVVANYAYVENTSGTQPYEIWAKTDGENDSIYALADKEGLRLEYIKDSSVDLVKVKQSALIQITNGMLTLSFMVVLVLCAIGFLIYWITSIRQRELLFGIYRAMGMSMKEILKMLLNEQVFCSLLAILCGAVSGVVTSKIFISLITIAYAPESHCLAYKLYTSPIDMIRIAIVIALMLGSCIFILAKMLGKMKIAQALKLGED